MGGSFSSSKMDQNVGDRIANIVVPDQTATLGCPLGPKCLLLPVCPKTKLHYSIR